MRVATLERGWCAVAHHSDEPPGRAVRKAATASLDDPRRMFSLRLTRSEYARLRFQARAKGVTMSRYLVAQGLREPVEQINPEQLREVLGMLRVLCRQIQGEATNINQIAHWANTHRRFPDEAAAIAADLHRQVDQICELRARIGELL